MKKIISTFLALTMLISVFCINIVHADAIDVTIDNVLQSYDVMPVIENGRTLVPMRGIFEALGAEIAWDDSTKTVTGKKGDISVSLQIGNNVAKINGEDKTLDVAATIINSRTMVPVRFISEALGCKVEWIADTKTVVINSAKLKLAPLVSEVHRDVPKEFTKSNDLKDMLYFTYDEFADQEAQYAKVKEKGEVVCTEDEFMDGIEPLYNGSENYGSIEVVDVEGQAFKKVLRITTTKVAEKSANFQVTTAATPEKNPGDGVNPLDKYIISFRMRTVSGGNPETGNGKVQVQIQLPVKPWTKALFQEIEIGKDWTIVYMPFSGVENATSIAIRPGFYQQVVELGGIEIINFGPDFDIDTLPRTTNKYPELEEGASWRDEALERIEKERKGDFTVVVKDKEGNAVPGAEVELDMFEHQFRFGVATGPNIYNDETYAKNLAKNFNTIGLEHHFKWAPYETDPTIARKAVAKAYDIGIKYTRGHPLIWERGVGSDGKTWLTPEYMFSEEVLSSREKILEKCQAHFDKILNDFDKKITEWDVVNEIVENDLIRGDDDTLFVDWFKMAREILGEDADLYWNDYYTGEKLFEFMDMFEKLGVDYDGMGIQSHFSNAAMMPTEQLKFYDRIASYNKKLKVTEYTCVIADQKLQANFTRDHMIAAFSHPDMDGYVMWAFWDGSALEEITPLYDINWNLKPCGQIYQDLVYNKWWTKDAKATTDDSGSAKIRGFYGDYDVTVNVNGKTVTDMVAFHKGYDNVLEIIVE